MFTFSDEFNAYEDNLTRILSWHPKWLIEQEKQKGEPSVEGPGMKLNHVPPVFSGFSDYCKWVPPALVIQNIFYSFHDPVRMFNNQRQKS